MPSSAWLRWLNKPFTRLRSRDAKPPARPRRFFPRLEPLEERVTPSSADLMVTKTDNTGTGMAVPGTAIIYTVTVTNAGPDDVTGATVADPFPATLTGVSFTASEMGGASGFTASGSGNISDTVDLPNGSSITYVATATISSAATGTLTNTATGTTPAGVTDTDANNSTATDTVTLTPLADLQVTKTDNTTNGQAVPGTAITYTITFTNTGPSDAPGTTVTDSLSGLTFTATESGGATGAADASGTLDQTVNLPTGSSITYTATGSIGSSATGTLVNTATATTAAGVIDTNANDSTATDTVTLTPQADLQVTKSAPATITAATDFIFTLTVMNNGPSDAQAVSLGDLLPSGETFLFQEQTAGTETFTVSNSGNQVTDTIPTLTAGTSATITVLAQANASAVNTTLTNTATVSSTTPDPTPGNNSSTALTKVVAPVITITATLPAGKVGVAYPQTTFTISGGTAPYTLKFTGTLPAGLSFSVQSGNLVLSGIPRTPGTFHFTITATDANKFTGVQAFTLTVQQGNLAHLVFLTQPGSAAVNGFLPTFEVVALDEFGNRLNGVTVTLHLVPVVTIGSGSFIRGSVLQAVTVNGVATFSRVGVSARGRYQLYAFSTPGFFTYSDPFDVGLDGRHSPLPA